MNPKNFLVKRSQKCNSTKSTQFTYLHQCAKMPRHMQKCAKWARGNVNLKPASVAFAKKNYRKAPSSLKITSVIDNSFFRVHNYNGRAILREFSLPNIGQKDTPLCI